MTADQFRRPSLHPVPATPESTAAPLRRELPFEAHLELLQVFLSRRPEIVESIERVMNGLRDADGHLQDRPVLWRRFEDGFFNARGITGAQSRLRGQLEEAHWASGFRPRDLPGLHNSIVDPVEMMVRGVHLWHQTQWPGRNGRLRYSHTLFNLYLVRCLALLSMRLWDSGATSPGLRLAQVQAVLDTLWTGTPADHPVLVRDARWLIQLAQSAATDELGGYFDVTSRVAATLPDDDRVAVHRAGVRMAGGHLRSQLHYYSTRKSVALDDHALVQMTRTSNALDFALLIQELVPLLEAYEETCRSGDRSKRLELADAILQGVSPEPELFLNRVDLLGAYSMIEHLFITTEDGSRAAYTPMGRRHTELIRDYAMRLARVTKPLYEDCPVFRPPAGHYSPYGILYGFTTDLLEHMALKTVQREGVTPFSLEDVFVSGDAGAERLAWVTGWRQLPHVPKEVQKLFEYPQTFADAIFVRLETALRRRVVEDASHAAVPIGRLFIVPDNDRQSLPDARGLPDLPIQYIGSSDMSVVAAQRAHYQDESQLLSDRREGRCVLSYRTPGGWVAISKAVLTEVLGAGRDVTLTGLPPVAAGVVKLMCPDLVVLPETPSPSAAL